MHLHSHGIPAVMLGKYRVDDRKAKEEAFFLHVCFTRALK